MENKLKLLISLYEAEKVQLQKLIDESVAEGEYLLAHYHSEALYQLNGRLQILNNIDAKLFDEKAIKQSGIIHLQELLKSENSDYMIEYLEKELRHKTEELEKLKQVSKQPAIPENEDLLDETFEKLIAQKIKNLKLILKKEDNLFVAFSYSKKVLKVTLPHIKVFTKKWILTDDNINSFKNSGFILNDNETKLTLTLTGSKEVILKNLKLILPKIFFEIFYYKQFDKESYIQFTERV